MELSSSYEKSFQQFIYNRLNPLTAFLFVQLYKKALNKIIQSVVTSIFK